MANNMGLAYFYASMSGGNSLQFRNIFFGRRIVYDIFLSLWLLNKVVRLSLAVRVLVCFYVNDSSATIDLIINLKYLSQSSTAR